MAQDEVLPEQEACVIRFQCFDIMIFYNRVLSFRGKAAGLFSF